MYTLKIKKEKKIALGYKNNKNIKGSAIQEFI